MPHEPSPVDPALIESLNSPDGLTPEQVDRARALLAAIVTSSEDAIVGKTLDSIVTYWNTAAERLFGFTAEEMVGQSILRIIPDDLQREEVDIVAKLRRGERIERYETTRVRKDGQKLDISLTISPIRDSSGTIIGAAKIAHDITARRRAERELAEREAQLSKLAAEREFFLRSERAARAEAEHLSHVKDEFLATLSHELRTPLNAIQGWATLLSERTWTADEYRRGLETIERNVRIQAQIVNDLLDMSRIVSGKIHLEVQPIYLHEVINNSIDAVRQAAAAKEIRLQPILDTAIGLVRGDPSRLQQVLWNLLTNAIKFTPKGGRVQIVLERVNSHAEICVEDNGIGIDPQFLPHVFDRFRQGDSGITRRFGGLGLGLSIVKNLIELHGGSIRVTSPGANLGSSFIISLPISLVRSDRLADAQTRNGAHAPEAVELPRLDEIRVLVVDDEEDGRHLIARILQNRGAQVECVSSATGAIQALSAGHFDVLLSDIGMPDMDGYQLIRKVKQLDVSRSRPIPAIAITAYARTEERQRSLLAGFHMHLSKPVEARELVASIAGLLHLSH